MDLNEEDLASDTDDDDYVPDGDNHAASEEEGSGEDEGTEAAVVVSKKKKSKAPPKGPTGRVSMFEENEDKIDWSADQKRERQELDEAVAKKKTEDIWADFKRDAGAAQAPKPRSGGLALGMSGTSAIKPPDLPAKPKSRFGSIFDNVESSSEKKEATTEKVLKPKNRFGSLFDAPSKDEANKVTEKEHSKIQDGKVEITKVFDFAGEVVKVSKQVSADSKEATKFLSSSSAAPAGAKRPGGLAGVVGGIAKKAKMGCLDKSKLDWNGFVAEEGIREELSTHNKGKEGYVEKLEFLERADHRQFEQEKAIRDKARKSLMK